MQVISSGKGSSANFDGAHHAIFATASYSNGGGGNGGGPFTLIKDGPGGETVRLLQWFAGSTGSLSDGAMLPFNSPFNVSFTTNHTDDTSMVQLVVAPMMNGNPGDPMPITGMFPASSRLIQGVRLPSNVSGWTNGGQQPFYFAIVSSERVVLVTACEVPVMCVAGCCFATSVGASRLASCR
jgi:hypothetical protein